ncbi:MAG TPA: glycosyltransferase family 4 protein [Candidatus Acidoferrum sp.]|nr:glycosyltransferase family 4 protein [Candidatus Acidoferrum sp.]
MEFERQFAEWASRLALPDHTSFMGFSYSSLELMEKEREAGRFVVVIQIDAAEFHQKLVLEEAKLWPNYAGVGIEFPKEYFERARREWALADLILVNSTWTRQMLVGEGVPENKIETIPLAYSPPAADTPAPREEKVELSVLWLGNVALGKGIQYLVEAARLLVGEPVRFTVAGQLHVSKQAVKAAPGNMIFVGPIPSASVAAFLDRGDVFVFPTLSDGFGITQIEAMAHGLPVITTPNCGEVVEHGVTGYIIEPRNPHALANAIHLFSRNRDLLRTMASRCVCAAKSFGPEVFGVKLRDILVGRSHGTTGAIASLRPAT